MTDLGTAIASLVAAGAVAASGVFGALAGDEGGRAYTSRTALVIDAGLARDGRELVDPRLQDVDAELRVARTTAEAETDLRYFAAQGYRLVVAGPDSQAAAKTAGLAVAVRSR